MKFSEKIVRLRKIKGITQDEFASAVGVSRQAVYKWECGQSYPEASKLVEIKVLFGISIDDLLDDSYEVALPEKKKRKRIPKAKIEKIEKAVEEELIPTAEANEPAVFEYVPTEEVTVVDVEAEPLMSEEVKANTVVEVAEKIVEAVKTEEAYAYTAPASEDTNTQPKNESASEKSKNEEAPKRRGFFSRLFGRK